MPTNDLSAIELAQCYLYENDNKPIAHIAWALKRSPSTVVAWLKDLGIYHGMGRVHQFTPNEEQLLWTYGKDGVTAHSLALKFNVADGTIVRWLKDMGIYKGRHIARQVTVTRTQPHCSVCEILLSEGAAMDGEGSETTCRYCLETTAKRATSGYILDIPELMLVKVS